MALFWPGKRGLAATGMGFPVWQEAEQDAPDRDRGAPGSAGFGPAGAAGHQGQVFLDFPVLFQHNRNVIEKQNPEG